MAVPTGTASLLDIQNEFGGSYPISLNEYYNADSGVPASGTISINDLRGKAKAQYFTLTANAAYLNLSAWATSQGWDGSSKLVVTVNSGVWVYSDSTGSPAMTISGTYPSGVELINYGKIIGKGGVGGYRANNAGVGGPAVSLSSTNCTIKNMSGGYIAGGGGGGAGSPNSGSDECGNGGGGAGGGKGGGSLSSRLGGAGGGLGAKGANGQTRVSSRDRGDGGQAGGGGGQGRNDGSGGGGGGRILPGTGGAGASGTSYGNGGNGGAAGNAGGGGAAWAGGGGGGWGAKGGSSHNGYWAGKAGGKAISASTAYTLSNSGTIYGGT